MSHWERFKSVMARHPAVTGAAIVTPVAILLAAPVFMAPAPDMTHPQNVAVYSQSVNLEDSQKISAINLDRFGVLVDQGYVSLSSSSPSGQDWSGVEFTGKDGINSYDDLNEGMMRRIDTAAYQALADTLVIHYAANQAQFDAAAITRGDFIIDAVEHGVMESIERARQIANGELDASTYGRPINDTSFNVLKESDYAEVVTTPRNAVPADMSMNMLLDGIHENMTPDMQVVTRTMTLNVDGVPLNYSTLRQARNVLPSEILPEAADVAVVAADLEQMTRAYVGYNEHIFDRKVTNLQADANVMIDEALSSYKTGLIETLSDRDEAMRENISSMEDLHVLNETHHINPRQDVLDDIIVDAAAEANQIHFNAQVDLIARDQALLRDINQAQSNLANWIRDESRMAGLDLTNHVQRVGMELNRMIAGTGIEFENPAVSIAQPTIDKLREVGASATFPSPGSVDSAPQAPSLDVSTIPLELSEAKAALHDFRGETPRGIDLEAQEVSVEYPSRAAEAARQAQMIKVTPFGGRPVMFTGQSQRIEMLRQQMQEVEVGAVQRDAISAEFERKGITISAPNRQAISLEAPKRQEITIGEKENDGPSF